MTDHLETEQEIRIKAHLISLYNAGSSWNVIGRMLKIRSADIRAFLHGHGSLGERAILSVEDHMKRTANGEFDTPDV